MAEPKSYSGILEQANLYDQDEKENFKEMTTIVPENKFTLNTAKQGTQLTNNVEIFRKNLRSNIMAKARLFEMDKSIVDHDELERMKVLILFDELQDDLNNHHKE